MSAINFQEPQYGTLTDSSTLKLQRRLPGPVERVWAYLTESDLRQQWLAAGTMDLRLGSSFELVWRNDELSDSPSERPEGFPEESRATCRITEVEPLRTLSFTWPGVGDITFQLDPIGDEVVLTVTHRRLADRATILMFGAGWHMHLDILVARTKGLRPASFWSGWLRLRDEYERHIEA